jgi:eukaryotic-like serine/threonine-protein kinase
MGEVYLAQDTKLDRKVALKILPAELASNRDRMERFIREAKSAAALNHPNIAHVYEIDEVEGQHFIAMEYIDGVTLREKIHREHAELGKLLRYLQHAAEGLAKAHAAGIVHRDLKPDNIMITREGYAKILDFGLAKLIEQPPLPAGNSSEIATAVMPQHSTPGTVMGTVGYMSPEQAQGKTNQIDQRSDIFSFGCILFEAVTGQKPFEGESVIKSLHMVVYEAAPPLADLNPSAPAELQRIVRRCLAKDAEERYQSIKEVAIELKELRREMTDGADFDTTVPPPSAKFGVPPSGGTVTGGQTSRPEGDTASTRASSAEYIVNELQRHKIAVLLVLFVVSGTGLAYAVYRFVLQGKPAVTHFQNMKITRVTTEGNVESATISPDGKYIAYSLEESGRRSVWTKHLGTGSRVQIVPTSGAFVMNASTFSPDGGYVFYTKVDEQDPRGAIYQVPVLGGALKKIAADVAQPVSISPDGRRIAFQRLRRRGTADEIFLANVDGTGERRLLEVREPQWLVGGSVAWSPNGQLLAVGYGDGKAMVLAVVSVADGMLRPITGRGWLSIGSAGWLADGSGVVFTAREQVLGALQIWQASYPEGEVRRITDDLNSYASYSLTLTADAVGIVSVQGDPVSNIWVAPDGDASRARAVTARKNVQEGHYAVSWTVAGKLLYDTDANGKSSIWVVNADGSDLKPLTDSVSDDYAPQASSDGRTIIFGSRRTNLYGVWRMDSDGGNPKQLTEETGVPTFSVSPDGRWVIYNPFVGGIRKVSVDGGAPIDLVAGGDERNPQISPDGRLLAYFFNDEQTKRPRLAVINAEGGTPVKTFDLPVSSLGIYETGFSHLYRGFHWSPDGRSLVYINTLSGVSNLWRQPLDGGKPVQITDFKSDLIYNFAYAPDGRTLALARGSHTRDAVLISEMK